MQLRFTFLGSTRITADEQLLDLPGNRPLALLAYLLVTGRPHSREHLVDLLFERPADPRAALRWTLSKLRKTLGEEAVLADRQLVSFNFDSNYTLDVDAFVGGDLEQYGGEFLQGLYVQDARGFENWLLVERERMRALYQNGLEEQLAAQIEAQDTEAVEKTALLLTQLDNLREDWLRALMSAYAQQGKFEAALKQYEFSRGILSQELDQEPSAETKALVETIMAEQAEAYQLLASRDAVSLPVVPKSDPESHHPGDDGEMATSGGHFTRQKWIGLVVLAALMIVAAAVVIANFDSLNLAGNARAESPLPAEPDVAGTTVTIAVFEEFEQREDELTRPFEERTGINLEFIGYEAGALDTFGSFVDLGQPLDIIQYPQPGLMADYARQGRLVDVRTFMDEAFLKEQYTDALLEAAMVDDQMPGIWYLANVKSLVWYPKRAFEEAGYTVPQSWDELMALSDQIVADGATPWCIGVRSGAATGWVGTDWVEDILLRTAPLETYDSWVAGELPFDSPEVRRAFGIMGDIWLAEGYVHGGNAGILSQSFNESALHLLDDPPGCYFNRQASFIVAFFPEDAVFGEDYDFFFLPPIDEEYGRPVLGGGDLMSMVNDRPEVREVMRWLATGESIRPLVVAGSHISPHRDTPFEWYSSPVQLKVAQLLLEADTYRFDASDMMPLAVGSGAFWQGIIEWVGGKDLDQVLRTIDDRWPAENGE